MSRGPGRLQQAVLGLLEERGPLPLPTIAWEVALATGVAGPCDNIDGEVYNNNIRAVKTLAQGERATLRRTEGRFVALDDVVQHYPDRTKYGMVRQMRRQLLPHVERYLRRHAPRPATDTEEYVLGRSDSPSRTAIESQWPTIEPLLLREVTRGGDDVTALLHVLTRGRAIVGRDTLVGCEVPLIVSVPILLKNLRSPAPRLRRVLEELQTYLPVEAFMRSRLMACLQRVAELSRHGPPTLKDAFLRYLYECDAPFLRTLEGHKEKSATDWWEKDLLEYSPLVHKLLDSSLFKPFEIYGLLMHQPSEPR